MVRRSNLACRAALSVTPLEDRAVPAGLIDVHHGAGSLNIFGDGDANHVRVEMVGMYQPRISSDSGPIRLINDFTGEVVVTTGPIELPPEYMLALVIHTGNGDDEIELTRTGSGPTGHYQWIAVLIDSGHGDDRVLIDNHKIQSLDVWTGSGDDSVSLRDCTVDWWDSIGGAFIDTGAGNDRVSIGGLTTLTFYISLGKGDDVLEGDPTTQMPDQFQRVYVDPGSGHDRLSNPDYFLLGGPPFDFEEIG